MDWGRQGVGVTLALSATADATLRLRSGRNRRCPIGIFEGLKYQRVPAGGGLPAVLAILESHVAGIPLTSNVPWPLCRVIEECAGVPWVLAAPSAGPQKKPDKREHSMKQVINMGRLRDGRFSCFGVPDHEFVADLGQLYCFRFQPCA
jgi:hypothetical protein